MKVILMVLSKKSCVQGKWAILGLKELTERMFIKNFAQGNGKIGT